MNINLLTTSQFRAAGTVLGKQAETEAAEQVLAESVGMHIRGSTVTMQGVNTNEEDNKRYYWHR